LDVAATSFILGYHGCDARVAETVFKGKASLSASHNDYDWLADGIYFWEHSARRAFEFATEVARRPHPSGQKIRSPAVVGAVIDLGECLNLLDSRFIESVKVAYEAFVRDSNPGGVKLPTNSGGTDLRSRNLDCAVLRTLHQMRTDAGEERFDTVRAAFIEGERLYTNAGFSSKNHIQICVRNVRNIKGYFRPLDDRGMPAPFT
jgi:hypothetical protein